MKRTAARMNAENKRHRKRTESETCFCLLLLLKKEGEALTFQVLKTKPGKVQGK